MMRLRTLARLAAGFTLLCGLVSLLAPSDLRAEENTKLTFSRAKQMYRDTEKGKTLLYDAEVSLYSLLGEPVVSTRLRYKFDVLGTTIDLPALDGSGTYFRTDWSNLPDDKRTLLQAYNIKVVFTFKTGLTNPTRIKIVSDIGDPGKPDGKTWSYNIPESPNWDEFMQWDNGTSTGFLNAATAKKVYKSGLKLSDVQILSARYTAHDLHNWYRQNTAWPKIRALVETYNYLAEGIERSTGQQVPRKANYRADPRTHGLDIVDLTQQDKLFRNLSDEVDKLRNLPNDLLPPDNPEPYRKAVSEAGAYLTAANNLMTKWRSPDLNPSTLPKGRPVKMPTTTAPQTASTQKTKPATSTRQTPSKDSRADAFYSFETMAKPRYKSPDGDKIRNKNLRPGIRIRRSKDVDARLIWMQPVYYKSTLDPCLKYATQIFIFENKPNGIIVDSRHAEKQMQRAHGPEGYGKTPYSLWKRVYDETKKGGGYVGLDEARGSGIPFCDAKFSSYINTGAPGVN